MGHSVLRRIPRSLQRLFLLRGESQVASTGLILAAILLLFMGMCAWWSVRTQGNALADAREKQIVAVGESLAETTAILIGLDEVSAVRRLLMETAQTQNLSAARIVLPGGAILAHTDVSQINQTALPVDWPLGEVRHPSLQVGADEVVLEYPLAILGRGSARLELSAPVGQPASFLWDALAGVGLIGAIALIALLLVYRRMRAKMRSMGVIRDALLALDGGETSTIALTIPERLGAEAMAWNALLARIDDLDKQLLTRRVGEAVSTRRRRGGDLDNACDVMRHGLLLVDRNLRPSYANGAALVYLRASREVVESAPLSSTISDPEVLNTIRSVIDGTIRTWTTVEVARSGEEGHGVLRFSIRPLRQEDSSAVLVVIEDVTQQRIADESRNSFVAQATHELRTPLTNIRLYAENAIEDGEAKPEIQRALNVINQEALRLERIVGDMLSVSEMEAGSYELVRDDLRLDGMFEDLKGHYQPYAREKDIALKFDLPPKLPVIYADRDKIIMALHNLVGNAIKYTPEHGEVTVVADVMEGQVHIAVQDTGIGIRPEEQERIFEKFYRADDARVAGETGTGLGLALARNVIRMHGGDITVESAVDEGSVFHLTLPRRVARAA